MTVMATNADGYDVDYAWACGGEAHRATEYCLAVASSLG
jgi:hypothetical protein